jgi:hypothetical protein
MDGGAVGILDGKLYGVENTCELTQARRVGDGTAFTALCSGEGESYQTDYVVVPTETGVSLTRDGETIQWRRCGSVSTMAPANEWVQGFGMGVTESWTRDSEGNGITFTCNNGADGTLHVQLRGAPTTGSEITFDVDGENFTMPLWSDGGRVNVECHACTENYQALWKALRAGSEVKVTDGSNEAILSLKGSASALDPEPCLPEGY